MGPKEIYSGGEKGMVRPPECLADPHTFRTRLTKQKPPTESGHGTHSCYARRSPNVGLTAMGHRIGVSGGMGTSGGPRVSGR